LLKQSTNIKINQYCNFRNSFIGFCTKPTRVTSESETLINHFYCNNYVTGAKVKTVIITCSISDHFGLLTTVQKANHPTKIQHQARKTKNVNYEQFALDFDTKLSNSFDHSAI